MPFCVCFCVCVRSLFSFAVLCILSSFAIILLGKISLFDLILYVPVNNLSVTSGRVFLGWTSTKLGWMCLAQGHNAVTPGEARTRSPSVSSQALYHRATALPLLGKRAGCFTFVVFWMSCRCYCSLTLPDCSMSWSIVWLWHFLVILTYFKRPSWSEIAHIDKTDPWYVTLCHSGHLGYQIRFTVALLYLHWCLPL